MKHLTLIAALMLGTTTLASAEPDASVFAAAGCDVATLVPVMSELNPGEVLYWTNTDGGGCAASKRGPGKNIFDSLNDIANANKPPAEEPEVEVAAN